MIAVRGLRPVRCTRPQHQCGYSLPSYHTPPPPTYFGPGGNDGKLPAAPTTPAASAASAAPRVAAPPPPPSSFAPQPLPASKSLPRARELVTLLLLVAVALLLLFEYERQLREFEHRLLEQQALYNRKLVKNFNDYHVARKQRDALFVAKEREHMKLEMKLSVHVGLLRRQLQELGVEPVLIEQAMQVFEKDVRIGNTLSNGLLLWVEDLSEVRNHVPHFRDYDEKRKR